MRCAAVVMMLFVVFAIWAAGAGIHVVNGDKVSQDTLRNGCAEAMEYICVVEQNGEPIANAKIYGGLSTGYGISDYTPIEGHTDSTGCYLLVGKVAHRIRCDVTLEGYYGSVYLNENYNSTHKVVDGRWEPFGVTNIVVLKRVINPVSMGEPCPHVYGYPSDGEWRGFDLMKRDWVEPFGIGKEADCLIRFLRTNFADGYTKRMEVSFTNNTYAGAYQMTLDMHSEMKSVYRADANGLFSGELTYVYTWDSRGPHSEILDKDEYLVFRTRTKIDENGRLVSAHYGKIYGCWRFSERRGMNLSGVFFNPVPNDTNLEDDYTVRMSKLNRGSADR